MGQVFTFAEIQYHRVPEKNAFPQVAEKIRNALEKTNGVIGAILCGSVLRGAQSRRSDIDCLVLYEGQQQYAALSALEELHREAKASHVPLEFICMSDDIAATALHSVTPSFAHHLALSAEKGGVIKCNPLPQITLPDISPKDDVLTYIVRKIQTFEEALTYSLFMEEWEQCEFLQKVLQAPLHVARKIVWCHQPTMTQDDSETVKIAYEAICDTPTFKLFERLLENDWKYTEELLLQLQNSERIYYRDMLSQLSKEVLHAIIFLRWNANHLLKNF